MKLSNRFLVVLTVAAMGTFLNEALLTAKVTGLSFDLVEVRGGGCVAGDGDCWELKLDNCPDPEPCGDVECEAPGQPCDGTGTTEIEIYTEDAVKCLSGRVSKIDKTINCLNEFNCASCVLTARGLRCSQGSRTQKGYVNHDGSNPSGALCGG